MLECDEHLACGEESVLPDIHETALPTAMQAPGIRAEDAAAAAGVADPAARGALGVQHLVEAPRFELDARGLQHALRGEIEHVADVHVATAPPLVATEVELRAASQDTDAALLPSEPALLQSEAPHVPADTLIPNCCATPPRGAHDGILGSTALAAMMHPTPPRAIHSAWINNLTRRDACFVARHTRAAAYKCTAVQGGARPKTQQSMSSSMKASSSTLHPSGRLTVASLRNPGLSTIPLQWRHSRRKLLCCC